MKAHSSSNAFTLIEVLIVIAIIGLLAAIAIPSFVKARQSSQKNACVANLREVERVKTTFKWETVEGRPNTGFPMPDLKCPAGGTYTFGNQHERPTCSHRNTTYDWDDHVLR